MREMDQENCVRARAYSWMCLLSWFLSMFLLVVGLQSGPLLDKKRPIVPSTRDLRFW